MEGVLISLVEFSSSNKQAEGHVSTPNSFLTLWFSIYENYNSQY